MKYIVGLSPSSSEWFCSHSDQFFSDFLYFLFLFFPINYRHYSSSILFAVLFGLIFFNDHFNFMPAKSFMERFWHFFNRLGYKYKLIVPPKPATLFNLQVLFTALPYLLLIWVQNISDMYKPSLSSHVHLNRQTRQVYITIELYLESLFLFKFVNTTTINLWFLIYSIPVA